MSTALGFTLIDLFAAGGTLAGDMMTQSNHAELMKGLYKDIGVAPTKVTHELRVFAAQAMHEMGVSLEVSSEQYADTMGSLCMST